VANQTMPLEKKAIKKAKIVDIGIERGTCWSLKHYPTATPYDYYDN
jgi:hypothetical protein